MAKAYLNVQFRAQGDGVIITAAHVGEKPGWQLPGEQTDRFWGVVFQREAATPEDARRDVKFLAERAGLKLPGFRRIWELMKESEECHARA